MSSFKEKVEQAKADRLAGVKHSVKDRAVANKIAQGEKALEKLESGEAGFFSKGFARMQVAQASKAETKAAIEIVNTRGGVEKEIVKHAKRGYKLINQTRSTTGKTTLTFQKEEA
jgi:hypothetical protein